MNRLAAALIALGMLCVGEAHAAVRYTDARIIEIETSDQEIYPFLEVLSGDAPPVGNGGTNSLPNRPYLFLATSAAEISTRRHMLASALAAHTSARQNVTESDHLVYPGTISRYIDTHGVGARGPNPTGAGGSSLYVFTHGVGINRYHCDLGHTSRPLHVLLGYANDVFGKKAFAQLDKQMVKWWRQNYGGAASAAVSMPDPTRANPRAELGPNQ